MKDFELIHQNDNAYLYIGHLLFAYIFENKKGEFEIWIEITTKSGIPKDETGFDSKERAIKRARTLAKVFLKRLIARTK